MTAHVEWYDANKPFVVMLILICWSVDLQETYVIGNIYKAQDNTFKQKIIVKVVNLNGFQIG